MLRKVFTEIEFVENERRVENHKKFLKSIGSTFFDEIKCKLRILDSFGTEEFFNDPSKAEKSGFRNPWGRLNLNLKQFWTFYPHPNQPNEFLGFAAQSELTPNDLENRIIQKKQNIAVLYGKKKSYFEGKENFINWLGNFFEIHTTITDGAIDEGARLNITNHPQLDSEGFGRLLESSKIFVGMGFPFEGPSPLEALNHGCYFLNPIFDEPIGRQSSQSDTLNKEHEYIKDFFFDKPTFRKLTSQVPYFEHVKFETIINSKLEQSDELLEKFNKIKIQEIFKPTIIQDFTATSLQKRIHNLLAHEFCFDM